MIMRFRLGDTPKPLAVLYIRWTTQERSCGRYLP